jgi:hypothetical protein
VKVFKSNKDRDAVGMANVGMVLEGEGDGIPPKIEGFFHPHKNSKWYGSRIEKKRGLSGFPNTNLKYSMNLINKEKEEAYLHLPKKSMNFVASI